MRRSDPDPERGGEARTGGDLEAGKIDAAAGEVEVAREGEGVAVGRDGGRARATEMTHHFLKRLIIGRNSRKRKK